MCQTSASNTFLFLMHFRVGGPAALALFVPLHTRLILFLLIWYLKILLAQYASALVKAFCSWTGSRRAELFSLMVSIRNIIHYVPKQAEIIAFFSPYIFSLTEKHTFCKESKRADQSDSNYKRAFPLLCSNVLNGKQATVKCLRRGSTHKNI